MNAPIALPNGVVTREPGQGVRVALRGAAHHRTRLDSLVQSFSSLPADRFVVPAEVRYHRDDAHVVYPVERDGTMSLYEARQSWGDDVPPRLPHCLALAGFLAVALTAGSAAAFAADPGGSQAVVTIPGSLLDPLFATPVPNLGLFRWEPGSSTFEASARSSRTVLSRLPMWASMTSSTRARTAGSLP